MSDLRYCIVPGCDSSNQSSALFEIPQNNPQLLEKWKKQLPLLESVQNRSICQNHFRSDEIIYQRNGEKQLAPEAVPTIFDINQMIMSQNLCRFCMCMLNNVESVWITENLKDSYEILMNEMFDDNSPLPKKSCLTCLQEIQRSEMVKKRIQSVQEKLTKLLGSSKVTIKEEEAINVFSEELPMYEEESGDDDDDLEEIPPLDPVCSISNVSTFEGHFDKSLEEHSVDEFVDHFENNRRHSKRRKIETETSESEEGSSKPRRIRKPNKDWLLEKVFDTPEEALDEIKKEEIWSKFASNETEKASVEYYRCNRVKFRGQQCQKSIKLLYHKDSIRVSKFILELPHNCDEIVTRSANTSHTLSKLAKKRILELIEIDMKPLHIVNQMRKEHFNISVPQVRNFKARMKLKNLL